MQTSQAHTQEQWTEIISARTSLFNLNLTELWRYRDLIFLLVKRDFVATYKQTVLGPLWHFIQPLLSTITFTIIFSRIANLSTDGLPAMAFYMSGIVCWNYFSNCLTKVSSTFTTNASIFGKVYFPRLVMPVSTVLSVGMGFLFQLFFFLIVHGYYVAVGAIALPGPEILLLPLLVMIMALLGLGLGIIVSSVTTKYRDFSFLVSFGVQLLMYATPVIYPMSSIPDKWKPLILLNPASSVIEAVRYCLFHTGAFQPGYLLWSIGSTLLILFTGVIIFNKVERNFMDHV